MSTNIGLIDRILRVALGLFLISLVLWGPQTAWGFIGIVPLLTAFVGFCPVYRLLGIRTLKKA